MKTEYVVVNDFKKILLKDLSVLEDLLKYDKVFIYAPESIGIEEYIKDVNVHSQYSIYQHDSENDIVVVNNVNGKRKIFKIEFLTEDRPKIQYSWPLQFYIFSR